MTKREKALKTIALFLDEVMTWKFADDTMFECLCSAINAGEGGGAGDTLDDVGDIMAEINELREEWGAKS